MPPVRSRIALVTCQPGPAISVDRDLPELIRALRYAGADARAVHWDDPDVDWSDYDLAVIRSTWDYSWRGAEFVAWADRAGSLTRLANPASVVRWNTDKSYLGDLAAKGVPVVPTRYLPPGADSVLPTDHEYVIKPTAGAGGRLAGRYGSHEGDAAHAHLARMHSEGLTGMVQPYLRNIDVTGERALVFFGEYFLHAVQKSAVLAPGTPYDARKTAHPNLRPWTPSDLELSIAEQALAAVPDTTDVLYARVDLVDGEDGSPVVMELELVEPNLFLHIHPDSVPVVVEEIVQAVR